MLSIFAYHLHYVTACVNLILNLAHLDIAFDCIGLASKVMGHVNRFEADVMHVAKADRLMSKLVQYQSFENKAIFTLEYVC